MKKRESKKAQVAVFIILGMLLIIVVILLVVLSRQNIIETPSDISNPQTYLDSCLKNSLIEYIENLSEQGGKISTENLEIAPLIVGDKKINYICHTPVVSNTQREIATCSFRGQGNLLEQAESEINNSVSKKVVECFASLREELILGGYEISFGALNPEVNTKISFDKVEVKVKQNVTIKKGEEIRRFENYRVGVLSSIGELMFHAIMNTEQKNSDCYQGVYSIPHLTWSNFIEDITVMEDRSTKLIKLTNRATGESFNYAIRTCVPAISPSNIPR